MYHPADGSDTGKALPELQKRIPRLALVELDFGKVIGEREIQLEMQQFQHTYMSILNSSKSVRNRAIITERPRLSYQGKLYLWTI